MKLERQLQEAEEELERLGQKAVEHYKSGKFGYYLTALAEQERIVDDLREEIKEILNSKK